MNTMTRSKKVLNTTEIAAAMGCKPSAAIARLAALGYTETCGRCGGSGQYSYNQIDGSRCFGCGGSGKKLARITAEVVSAALARIAAGELVGYFAEVQARREIASASKALWAAYMSTAIGAAYTKASMVARTTDDCAAFLESPVARAQQLLNAIMDRASAAEHDKKSPHLDRIAVIRSAREMVLAIDAAWMVVS